MSWEDNQLNNHLYQLDAEEARQEAIEDRAEEIAEQLKSQSLVKINGDSNLYHIDEFIGDDVFNTGSVCNILNEKPEQLMTELIEKFGEWCVELATKDIDNSEPPECDYDTREEYEGDL